jgi:hypothetical protein
MLAYADLAAVVDLLRAAVAARNDGGLGPGRPAADYLPTPARLQQQFASGQVDPAALLRTMLSEVAPRWSAVSAGDIDELERIHSHVQAMAATSITMPPGIEFRYKDYALRFDLEITAATAGGPVSMRSLCEASGSALDTMISSLTGTAARARGAVMALRRFDDVLIRILASRQAAADTGLPVSRIVTLHRLEGNLGVFPSHQSLELGIPSAAGIGVGGIGLEPCMIDLEFRPSFGHLVWLADETKVRALDGTESLEALALAGAFMLQAIGGDRVASGVGVLPVIEHFATWSAHNRTVTGAADPWPDLYAQAGDRWAALEDQLELTRLQGHDGAGPEALRMAPKDPVAFLAGILSEGAVYQEALRSGMWLTGTPTALRAPEGLAAARYNWQLTPDGTAAMIFSAMRGARSGASGALKTAINADATLTAFLSSAERAVDFHKQAEWKRTESLPMARRRAERNAVMRVLQAAAILEGGSFIPLAADHDDSLDLMRMAPEVRSWLLRGDNLQRLGDYFDRTGLAAWDGYAGLRRYGATARRLHEFYSRVFP